METDRTNFHPTRMKMLAGRFSALFALVMVLALLAGAGSAAAAKDVFPEVIPLPDGFQPEGIAVGYGHTFYVGSIPTGAIYSGSLRTGEGDILVPPAEGRNAIGLDFDERSGYLFVAGGPSGQGFVYDGETGALVEEYTFTTETGMFINDVIVTRQAAYFTSSFEPYFYVVPLGPGGELADPSEVEKIALGGEWVQAAGFSSNGIVASPNGEWLIIVNSSLGTLYRVDPQTGLAEEIDLGGDAVPTGDGLLLLGQTLYVVQNRLNQIAVIELSPDYLTGEVVDTITDSDFDIPTTIARFGSYLYAVNARFGITPTPDTEYDVVQVMR